MAVESYFLPISSLNIPARTRSCHKQDNLCFCSKEFPLTIFSMNMNGSHHKDVVKASLSSVCLVLKLVEWLDWKKSHIVYERVGFTEYVSFKDGERNKDANDYVEEDFYII